MINTFQQLQQPYQQQQLQHQPNTIFVGGINWRANEESVKTYFSTFGKVLDCKIIMDKITQKSKGYGFITFDNPDSINKVKSSLNLLFMGKNMNIGEPVRKPNQQQQQHININHINSPLIYQQPQQIHGEYMVNDGDSELDDEQQIQQQQDIDNLGSSIPPPLLLSSTDSSPLLISNQQLQLQQQQQQQQQIPQIHYHSNNHHHNHHHNKINQQQQQQQQHYPPNFLGHQSYGYLIYDPVSGSTYQIPYQYLPPQQASQHAYNNSNISSPVNLNNSSNSPQQHINNYNYHSPPNPVYQQHPPPIHYNNVHVNSNNITKQQNNITANK